jgi:hypothetical protein
MSDHALPDDLSRWSTDPYELLGVERGVAPRDLKRNYTRLIRTFKPEQFPEHFRRIREAYERILREVGLLGGIESPIQRRAEDARVGHRDPATPIEQIMSRLWEQAIAGEEADAYGNLSRLLLANSSEPGIYARLYWLLAVNPDLDRQRAPAEWLVQGIAAGGLTGTLAELMRREIEQHPQEALSTSFDRLIERSRPPAESATLLTWRWRAAARLQRWDIIAGEMESMRVRMQTAQEEWLRLLLMVADVTAWGEGNLAEALFRRCVREIRKHEHIAVKHADWFDRLDYLQAVRSGCRELPDGGSALVRVIAAGWQRPHSEVRPLLLEFCSEIQGDAQRWLTYLDEVERIAPPVLGFFGDLLRQLDLNTEVSHQLFPPPEQVEQLASRFIAGADDLEYAQLRHRLLDFCLAESIQPEWLAQSLHDVPLAILPTSQTLGGTIIADWPLRTVCLAVWLFWLS